MDAERTFAATAVLLTSDDWRQRVVEQIRPLTADHYELRRSFQFEVPSALLPVDITNGPMDVVLLPVCWLPKRALLDFDVTAADGSSLPVLERKSIAGITAGALELLRPTESIADGLDEGIIESACWASLSPWSQAMDRAVRDSDALFHYLHDATAVRITPREAERILERSRRTATRAYSALERSWTVDEVDNVALSAALLVPYLVDVPVDRPGLLARVDSLQTVFDTVVESAVQDRALASWLRLYVELGVRWPVLVHHRLTTDEPFLIKTRELRSSGHPRSRLFRHEADLAAARSHHLSVATPDPRLWLAEEPRATDDHERELGSPETFEATTWTSELFAGYTSRHDRPHRAHFLFTFGLEPTAWLPYSFAGAFVGAALIALWFIDVDGSTAAVLGIPPAVVSAFLVTTDSPLVARFLFVPRLLLVLSNVALWCLLLWKLSL